MKWSFSSLLMLGGVALSACVPPQQVEVIEKEQRRLRTESTKILLESSAIRNEFDSIRSTLADTRANIQQVQGDVNALKEKVDEFRYQLDRQIGRSTREGDQRIKELEDRIVRIDNDLKTQGTLLEAREEELRVLRKTLMGTRGTPSLEGAEEPTRESEKEKPPTEFELVKKDYEGARKLLEQKDYKGSIDEFKKFLKKYPESEYADNAQYWIGESYYALREFDQAILEFDVVRRKYPKGDKVPAARLKQGFAFAELGDKVDARLILQELIDRYPQSPEAVKAKQKLKTLES